MERHSKAKTFFTAENISEVFRQDRVIKPEDPGYFEFQNYDFESNIFTDDIHDHHDDNNDDITVDEKPIVCLLKQCPKWLLPKVQKLLYNQIWIWKFLAN